MDALDNNGENGDLDPTIVEGLLKMLDEKNELAKVFRMAKDRFQESDLVSVRIRIIASRARDGRQYNLPTSSEIAALMVGNGNEHDGHRDIIVDDKSYGLRRIDELHPSFMAMQYPLLFPYAEDGFRLDIKYRNSSAHKRTNVSVREYNAYRIQLRHNEGHTLIRGGRLFQQFVVDAYACIEEYRLQWVRTHQTKLRAELYCGLKDAVVAGDTTPASAGKRLVLPSSFTGGPRYMIQNYQDAMAICRWAGTPDLFITFTCNPKWPEIQHFLNNVPGQKYEDRPDIVSRVFKIKLDLFMKDLQQGQHFGRVRAAIYTIEFQKRGLPHAHILLFLHPDDKPQTPSDVNKIISAELPDKDKDPVAYEAVVQFMIHGPCGTLNENSPCIIEKKCSKHYPKKNHTHTSVDENGFPVYRRRDNGRTALKNGIEVDNKWVIPHNVDLVVKYQAHTNVEYCNKARSLKYLFKYINKGSDRATMIIEENLVSSSHDGEQIIHRVDEVKNYLDCRYISAPEACWRIFNFDIQYRDPYVERLPFHLADQHMVNFNDDEDLEDVAERDDLDQTKFTKWFEANAQYPEARKLTYIEFPTKFVWHKDKNKWEPRKSGRKIGRVYFAHPTSGERYYLRILLNIVKGPLNWDDLKTFENKTYDTFKEACKARGLLDDDNEYSEAIKEASHWGTGHKLRSMFVSILLLSEVTDPLRLWENNWQYLSDDILYKQRRMLRNENLHLTENQIKNYALFEIEKNLIRSNKSLKDFPPLPYPDMSFLSQVENRLLSEELNYDIDALRTECLQMQSGLNAKQQEIFQVVIDAVDSKKGGVFFVYGCGGTIKAYLYKTIISKLRSEEKIVLAVASSGIASLLLPGGRTAHSRFKIQIPVTEDSCCDISQQSNLAELIRRADLIVWDEAPMNHRHVFESIDRTLKDLMRFTIPNSDDLDFGGKTFLLGGDFRQILPVIPKGSREDIVDSSVNRSYVWRNCRVFVLTENMRLSKGNLHPDTAKSVEEFSKWVLDLGDGKLPSISVNEEDDPVWIKIPDEYLIPPGEDPVEQIVSTIYPDLLNNYNNQEYLQERSILAPTNESVDEINSYIISLLSGNSHTYYSIDSINPMSSSGEDDQALLFQMEMLNGLKFSGIPNHELELKVGVPIMLLRNMDQSAGLCNGTRLIVTRLGTKVIEATIITGNNIGASTYIPRIIMSPSDTRWTFVLRRKQFPVKVCFAMTINKSQGQTFNRVGIYLPKPIFTHGQLYVAISRTTSREGLKILIKKNYDEPDGYTQNIVYKEVFNNLPSY